MGRLTHAGNGRVPWTLRQRAQARHLFPGGIGRSVDFRACKALRQQAVGQDGRVAQHVEPGKMVAAVQRTLPNVGQGSGQGQLRDARAVPECPRANAGQRLGQLHLRDVRAIPEGFIPNGGDGAEHLHIRHAAVGKGLCANGGKPAAVVGVEGTDGLIALEHAVAQGGDINIVIDRPDGQVGLAAVIRRPYAACNRCNIGLIDGALRHAGGFGIVDPHSAVGALVAQHGFIGTAVLLRAVPGQIQVGHIGFGKRVRCNVDGRIEVKHQVIQRGLGKGAGADGFQAAAQVQLLTPCILKCAFTDGSDGAGQGQDGFHVILERPRADFLQALAPVDPQGLRVVERFVADGFQRGGEAHIGDVAGILERARLNALQPLGEHHAIDGIIALECLRANGLHRHAADGRGNLHIGVILPVAGDRAGGRVKGEPVLGVLLFGNHGVFAAGLQMIRRAVGIPQRRRVGGQLIVRHIDGVVLRQHGEAPVPADEQGACTLEADFPQICTGADSSVHDADAGWNGQAGQRAAA